MNIKEEAGILGRARLQNSTSYDKRKI